jgi:hypothetical protein
MIGITIKHLRVSYLDEFEKRNSRQTDNLNMVFEVMRIWMDDLIKGPSTDAIKLI